MHAAGLLAEADRELPRAHRLLVHRDPQPARDPRNEGALPEHGRQDDDEDQAVDAVCAVDATEDGEGAQQDRHGALQAAPGDERPLGARERRAGEGERYRERPREDGEHECQHRAVQPRLSSPNRDDASIDSGRSYFAVGAATVTLEETCRRRR